MDKAAMVQYDFFIGPYGLFNTGLELERLMETLPRITGLLQGKLACHVAKSNQEHVLSVEYAPSNIIIL